MKVATFIEPGKMVITDTPKPVIEQETDAVIKIVRACVCGSDLWWYRGISKRESGSFAGHEAIGIVEEVGTKVTDVSKGDFVIVPFTHGCGQCPSCKAGFDGNCTNHQAAKNVGYQGQYLRYTNANWALVKIPGQPSDYDNETLNSLLTLSDVMATGYHAAATAEVKEGDTVVVMGDGAVGLCGVIAAKMLGANRIIAMSRHKDRQELALTFGATDIVEERGDEAVKRVLDLTNQAGADAVLECVGIPQNPDMNTNNLFWKNIGLRGGIASVTTFDKSVLLDAVLTHKINPGLVFTKSFVLDDIQKAYEAMDKRDAIKSLVIVD
ncbi:TPA: alcohol dehydrogenase catalytic domain-containing protein [Streptococcus agalactiae]|uniref:alcohol dehydrogenase catalytic domain-containing protein n=1 Tax=Streptococcus agalactiae TaxID=1311 RepID=UPI0002BBFFD7|nr:alcohol dehydrogenase catalytic domain-containing protein [Streptococcus agalactiae]EPT61752.1 molecular chaperone GroES [Streptococcus agalactiae CCUG 37737]HEO6126238.1 alcohol dehydrogenase catalytic domain-containing protein [Streptococcus agalactiae]